MPASGLSAVADQTDGLYRYILYMLRPQVLSIVSEFPPKCRGSLSSFVLCVLQGMTRQSFSRWASLQVTPFCSSGMGSK